MFNLFSFFSLESDFRSIFGSPQFQSYVNYGLLDVFVEYIFRTSRKGGTSRCEVSFSRKNNDEFNTCKSFMNSGKELGISRV